MFFMFFKLTLVVKVSYKPLRIFYHLMSSLFRMPPIILKVPNPYFLSSSRKFDPVHVAAFLTSVCIVKGQESEKEV